MNASASFPNAKGAVLLTVIVVILIMGIVGVTLYSLTYTSTFTQLAAQNSARSFFLAESGFRVVASEYTHAAAASKNAVLEGLHNTTLTLPDNAGQFDLRIYPYWFYVRSNYTAGDSSIAVKMPGGIPLRDPSDPTSPVVTIPGSGKLKLKGKTQRATITASLRAGSFITFYLNPGFPYDISTDEELFLVFNGNISPTTITPGVDLTLPGADVAAQFFPAENGSFRIYNENNDKADYTYRYRLPKVIDPDNPPSTITLSQIDHQDPDNGSASSITLANPIEIFLGKNIAVYSASTYGQGIMAGKKEIGEYTDVGLDAGFGTDKETISFLEDIADFSPSVGKRGGTINPEDPQPIIVDEINKQIELGRNIADHYGSVWYKGDTDIANCIEGKCNLGKGFRAYFEFQTDYPSGAVDEDDESRDFGDGFTFAIISAENYIDGDTGAGGEYLGYAGVGTGTGLSNRGLQPPKMAAEIDTYPNSGGGDICGSNSRRDGPPNANHVAAVYWGEESPGSFDADGGYLSLGAADWSSPEGTITFWFKRDAIDNDGDRLWGQHDDMEMRFDGSNLVLDWGAPGSLSATLSSNEAGKWYFVAITWDQTNTALNVYWRDESMISDLAITNTWVSNVSNVGVNENLFMNSSGNTGSKEYQVDGKAAELRYYGVALDSAAIDSIYSLRESAVEPVAYFPLQSDLVNRGLSTITATTVGVTGWSSETPSLYPTCSSAPGKTYDDNRHGSGGDTLHPLNSQNGYPTVDTDGYYPNPKVSGEANWLEDGETHSFRMELIRPLLDDPIGSGIYKYQFKIWIDCGEDCALLTEQEQSEFKNVRHTFTVWEPQIEKTVANGNPLLLEQSVHDDLKNILFGFTEGTGGAVQNIILQNFELFFLKTYPDDLSAW